MISTMLALMPPGARARVRGFVLLSVVSVALRAVAAVLLLPLVGALFGERPSAAWPWVAGLAACVVLGWLLDTRIAAIGFDLGFATLDHAQHEVAERLSRVPLEWFDAEHTASARTSIAATGPDLVGIVVYLLTPLLQALLLPVVIGLALLPISWPLGVAALAGVPVLLGAMWGAGRLSRRVDGAAASANAELTGRIVEFGRTQQALRAARRVEPARSEVGRALAGQHGAHRRLVLMQVPGELLFSVATQVVLLVLGGTTAWLAVSGELDAPTAVAMIVVIVRYIEPVTALGDLAPALEGIRSTLRSIGTVLDAPLGCCAGPRGGGGVSSAGHGAAGGARRGGLRLRGPAGAPGAHALLRRGGDDRARRSQRVGQEHRPRAPRGTARAGRGAGPAGRPPGDPPPGRGEHGLPAPLPLRRDDPGERPRRRPVGGAVGAGPGIGARPGRRPRGAAAPGSGHPRGGGRRGPLRR